MKIKSTHEEVPSIHKGLCPIGKEYAKFLKFDKDPHTSLDIT